MTLRLPHAAASVYRFLVAEAEAEQHTGDERHSEFGVHITYEDLYDLIVFLAACVYIAGKSNRALYKMLLNGRARPT
jgi:hypothetical protein